MINMTAQATGTTDLLDGLVRRLDDFLRNAPLSRDAQGLASLTLPAPRIPVGMLPCVEEGALFWTRPEDGCTRLGLGRAVVRESSGDRRFEVLDEALGQMSHMWGHDDPHFTGFRPRVFAGFAFDSSDPMRAHWTGFPNAALIVPSLLYECRNASCAMTFTATGEQIRSEPACLLGDWMEQARLLLEGARRVSGILDPRPQSRVFPATGRKEWERRVARALDAIRTGELNKLVLSRRVRIEGPGVRVTPGTLEGLAGANPGRVQFAVTMTGATLFGSSPEHLVSLKRGTAWSDAVAGTHLFPAGTAARDRIAAFSSDPKSRHEQALVVEAIAGALRTRCRDVRYTSEPGVVRFSRMGHLWTRVSGQPRPGVSLLELAAALHPTPAVGGSPGDAAIDWLTRLGEERRGWYTGAAGWVDPAGQGTLSVVLRCALVRGEAADVFAGAGIVTGSRPAAEFEETEWKLRTMLEIFGSGDGPGRFRATD